MKAAKCLSWFLRWCANRAPPARRFAAQGCSHICFRPVTPVPARATALCVPHDIEVDATGAARPCPRNNWPETDVGAALCCEAPRGRRSIFQAQKIQRQAPQKKRPGPNETGQGRCAGTPDGSLNSVTPAFRGGLAAVHAGGQRRGPGAGAFRRCCPCSRSTPARNAPHPPAVH